MLNLNRSIIWKSGQPLNYQLKGFRSPRGSLTQASAARCGQRDNKEAVPSPQATLHLRSRRLLWQFREILVDFVEETLGFSLECGSATLVMLEVAQGGICISPRTKQTGALLGRLVIPSCRPSIHDGHVEACMASIEMVSGLFKIKCGLLEMLAGLVQLSNFGIESAQPVVQRREVS